MLRLNSISNTFAPLERQAELRPKSFFDRYDLREFLSRSPRDFFSDAGLELLAVSSGEQPFALDPEGRVYVIAYQQGSRRPDLSAALQQASRLAALSSEAVVEQAKLVERSELSAFLRTPITKLNSAQGVVLVAESFDEGALRTILWLQARYGLHVSCVQLTLLSDERGRHEYVAARVASLDNLNEPPERWVVSAPEEEPEEEVDIAPVTPPAKRASQPEWRRDFSAVFDQPEPEEALISFSAESIPLPVDEGSPEAIASLFDEPETPPAAFDEGDGERRDLPRSPEFHARRLRLDYNGRLLGARLVDFSDHGLGVEVLSPLPVGASVDINGEVSGDEGLYGITGQVVVQHCRGRQDGVSRIGFSLDKANVVKLSSPPEDFDRR